MKALSIPLFVLLASAASSVAPSQSLPLSWNRAKDWVAQKNPGKDSMGNAVWEYRHRFGNRGQPNAWSKVWGNSWTTKHSSGYYNDTDPIYQHYMLDFNMYTLWQRYHVTNPEIWFHNTTNKSFLLAVEGTLFLHWNGVTGKAYAVDVIVDISHYDKSTGKRTFLLQQTHSKPSTSTVPEGKSFAVKTATVRLDPGDHVRLSIQSKYGTPGHYFIQMSDYKLDYVRKSIALATEKVRNASPKNPMTLMPGRTSRPLLGKTWDPYISDSPTNGRADLLALGVAKIHVGTPLGTLLTDPLALVTTTPRASFLLAIPNNTAFAGINLTAQGASITSNGGLSMANALDIQVGDF